MAEQNLQRFIRVPLSVYNSGPGFSIDIGGTAAKLVYRSKKHDNVDEGNFGILHLKTFPCSAIDELLEFIIDECDYVRSTQTVVNVTGFHTALNKSEMQTRLGITLNIIPEFVAFALAASTMVSDGRPEDLFIETRQEYVETGIRIGKALFPLYKQMGAKEPNNADDKSGLEKEKFPFILAVCGSGTVFLKIEADASFELLDVSNIGGRGFLGISRALTGIHKFEDLEVCVNNNDGASIDCHASDIMNPETKDPIYNNFPEEIVFFNFGKIWDAPLDSKFDKGDMVHSLLRMFSEQLAKNSIWLSESSQIPNLFFAGNFVSVEKVREWVTWNMETNNYLKPESKRLNYQFIKNGGCLGALGCFLYKEK